MAALLEYFDSNCTYLNNFVIEVTWHTGVWSYYTNCFYFVAKKLLQMLSRIKKKRLYLNSVLSSNSKMLMSHYTVICLNISTNTLDLILNTNFIEFKSAVLINNCMFLKSISPMFHG